jgi:hypothetical protein
LILLGRKFSEKELHEAQKVCDYIGEWPAQELDYYQNSLKLKGWQPLIHFAKTVKHKV